MPKFFYMEFTARQLADYLSGIVEGDPDVKVNDFSKIESGKKGTLSFLSNLKYESYLYGCEASIVLVSKDFVPREACQATLIRVDNPYESLAKLMHLAASDQTPQSGVSSLASIHPEAQLGEHCSVDAFVFISEGVVIGDNAQIHASVYIGKNVKIGTHVVLFPGVVIQSDTVIGDHCVVHANAVIGADGFGFAPTTEGTFEKIPQLGNVVIGNKVEIGANTTIDRATIGSTLIGDGVKIDNLVQVAHNVEIGEHTVIASQSGIAGSTKVGKKVMFGGQVGISGHIEIADGSILGAKSGVSSSIKTPGQIWLGAPIQLAYDFRRASAVSKNLPELQRVVYELKRKIEELEQKVNANTNQQVDLTL